MVSAGRLVHGLVIFVWYHSFLWMNVGLFKIVRISPNSVDFDFGLTQFHKGIVWSLLAVAYHVRSGVCLMPYLRRHRFFGLTLDPRTIKRLDDMRFDVVSKYQWLYLVGYAFQYLYGFFLHLSRILQSLSRFSLENDLEWIYLLIVGYYCILSVWLFEVFSKIFKPFLKYFFRRRFRTSEIQKVVIVSAYRRLLVHINMRDGRLFGERMDFVVNHLGSGIGAGPLPHPASDLRTSGGDGWWIE